MSMPIRQGIITHSSSSATTVTMMVLQVDHVNFGSSVIAIVYSLAQQRIAVNHALGHFDECLAAVA